MYLKIKYHGFFLFIITCFIACNGNPGNKRMPDLRETYSSKDKNPFGAYIAFQQLKEMFYQNTIRTEYESFEDSPKDIYGSGSVYICISAAFFSSDEDAKSIIDFANSGNDIFIATRNFEPGFLDQLECKVSNEPALLQYGVFPYRYTGLKVNSPGITDTAMYRYFYLPFNRSFTNFNENKTRVLGFNENGDPDYIVIFKGKGRIFLHCEPRAFSNYFLLQKNNYQYLQNTFGYLNPEPEHVYWNDFYTDAGTGGNRDKSFSSLSEVLKHPPLAAAFWLAILLLLLYIIFESKRRQRIIELVKPYENTTVTFTETIGRLYLQKKDNKNIAEKMITYFNEYIRNNYFLNTNSVNDDFVTTLGRKSGVPRDKIDSLFRAIHHAQTNDIIDDYQLLSLNEQIQTFYKKIK